MSGEADKAKGRIEQAVGDLTDDKDLKRDGKIDEASGKVKDTVDKVKDKLTGDDRRRNEDGGRGRGSRPPSRVLVGVGCGCLRRPSPVPCSCWSGTSFWAAPRCRPASPLSTFDPLILSIPTMRSFSVSPQVSPAFGSAAGVEQRHDDGDEGEEPDQREADDRHGVRSRSCEPGLA